MLTPKKMTKKDRESAIYAGPENPVLKVKKAEMLKTSADQPRELMKRKETISSQKPKVLKGLIGRAMDKAKSRIERKVIKENKLVAKGNKAVDEGRDKKAGRVLGRAAKVENRIIKATDKKRR